MNAGITMEEEYFIRAYILPNRRERMRFELSSIKRRSDCIWRFAHCARDMLKLEYIHPVFSKEGDLWLNSKLLRDEIGDKLVYILDYDKTLDRARLPFRSALSKFMGCGPYIMIDTGLTFAFVETEPFCESHEYLFLKK